MKVNPMHSLNAYQKQQNVGAKKKADVNKKHDQLQISSAAKQMQEMSRITTERQEKVERIKAEIDQGTYKVDAKEVAKKFYEFWD
ncbi:MULTISPECIES: flagellar biosynthesis anti-sigma factor FlgM [Bacillaceae]|uniref:Negative regulator of flagellin synthesis n=1 Tax=Evansella alkalicola TaxID=745819 RepID=A0ABS6JT41_9BACI|nr:MULTISPECIES: flagellar biosynthesis anti-sigma factor FlgM [Bacillaceae]MBU9721731.1 flagellar biosynthesis anti-sigma factor FlgM [Bacillus alkalicola]